jgi:c-di-GMP-binding flagellar brake protein YcgR
VSFNIESGFVKVGRGDVEVGKSPAVAKDAPRSREAITTIEATPLGVGNVLQMQSTADAPRLMVKLIGYLKNRGLIVTVPESDGEFVMLKDGQSFIVRFFSGKNAYAFTSVVGKQTSVPFPHVHLSYPREVRGLEIRKDARIDVSLITAIGLDRDSEAKSLAGKIVNLSIGGGAFRAKTRLASKGDTINVKFKLLINEMDSYMVFDALVRSVTEDLNDPVMPYLYGIQFINMDQNMTLAVAAFVYQKIAGDTH